jgi:adenylosuccinate synthase
MEKGNLDAVVGLQRGDEGKGRVIDYLAGTHDVIVRCNGGPNAGHSILLSDGEKLALHQVPSGVAHEDKLNVIGNGVLLDPIELLKEILAIRKAGLNISPDNLAISSNATLILPHHVLLDKLRENGQAGQGSTKHGIAFAAADKYERIAVRASTLRDDPLSLEHTVASRYHHAMPTSELTYISDVRRNLSRPWIEAAQTLAPYITDTVDLLHRRVNNRSNILAEGAQAFWLDIEHGMVPEYTTSSHTTVGGILNGLGMPHTFLKDVIGVAKLTQSHVGGGPFVTEIIDNPDLVERIRGKQGLIDSEYGASTGRPRRLGYFDLPSLRQAIRVNGVEKFALTKLDCARRYGRTMLVAVAHEDRESGQIREIATSSADELARSIPKYEEIELWDEPICDAHSFSDLPKKAQDLVRFIEDQTGVSICMVGVGAAREQLIVRD